MEFGDTRVLDGVSFDVRRGETLCILGGSGGGKSTCLKIMIGALRPTSGSVRVAGEEITAAAPGELDRLRRRFGVMFQSGALLDSLTVAENVALPIEYHTDLDAGTIATMVKIKLRQVDMLHAADRLPGEISGGMRKRAAIARAIALDPEILFYDEPSAGLDPIGTARIDRLIRNLQASMGMTSVVVTHVLESVQRIADHVVMLHEGRVALDGGVEDLLASEDEVVSRFVRGDLEGSGTMSTSTEQYLQDLLW